MNTHGINSAELNGSSGHFTVIDLGTATATLEFVAFERSVTQLSGTIGITFSALGDITKMSQLGTASTGITLDTTASLDKFAVVGLGAAQADLVFAETASLSTVIPLGNAVSDLAFSVVGDLYLVVDMTASATLAFEAVSSGGPQLTRLLGDSPALLGFETVADLTQHVKRNLGDAVSGMELEITGSLIQYVKNYLPNVSAPLTLDAQGDLTKYARMGMASADMTFIVGGVLANYIYMSGSAGIVFDTDANLFNNPNAYDPPANVLTRPYVNRVMVRQ